MHLAHLSDVAEFSKLPGEVESSWKHRGQLLQSRGKRPRAITYMGQTLIVGGTLGFHAWATPAMNRPNVRAETRLVHLVRQ